MSCLFIFSCLFLLSFFSCWPSHYFGPSHLPSHQVSLASGYEGIFDAAKGPLKKCDWGIVEEDDGDETKAFKVKAKSGEKAGSTWWYDAKALQEYVEVFLLKSLFRLSFSNTFSLFLKKSKNFRQAIK